MKECCEMKTKTKKKIKALIVTVMSDDMGLEYFKIVEAEHFSQLHRKQRLYANIRKVLPDMVKKYSGQDIDNDDMDDLIDGEPFSTGTGFVQVKFF